MNKYEYAMHKIREYANDGFHSKERTDRASKHFFEHKEALQELVDKATPKKAVWIEDFLRCPSCLNYDSLSDGYGEHHNYCNDCGQALDWSKDEI